jgi:alpha-beta hydrolase superfamily lysophospholipase
VSSIFDSSEFNRNLFFPRPDQSSPPFGSDEIYIEVEPAIRVHIRRYPNSASNFTLLYFHGNGEIAGDYDELSKVYSDMGVEFIVCDYRGYGKSDGMPTLRSVLQDSHIVYEHLRDTGSLKEHVGVMGRSLGSAPAIELCIHYQEIRCCIIESGYADPIPLVERRGLKIEKTTPEEDSLFNNSMKIPNVSCPLLIMHGEDDFLISPREAQLNFQNARAETKFLEILEGVGHNDMMMARDNQYFSVLGRFIKSLPEMKDN